MAKIKQAPWFRTHLETVKLTSKWLFLTAEWNANVGALLPLAVLLGSELALEKINTISTSLL